MHKETDVDFPSYFDDEDTKNAIRKSVMRRYQELCSFMMSEFGRSSVRSADLREALDILSDLASDVSHKSIGAMALKSSQQSRQASVNMLRATFAGIRLGEESKA